MSLTEIANKHHCDKGTLAYEAHGYTEEYHKYIPQKGIYTLLEIGIWHGDSLRVWKEYNTEAIICGLDIDIELYKYRKEKDPMWLIGNATNKDFVNFVLEIYPTPTFIIDDGSHKYEDVLTSFNYFFPKLKDEGYYFIEDVHAQQARRENLIEEIIKLNTLCKISILCNNKLLVIQK